MLTIALFVPSGAAAQEPAPAAVEPEAAVAAAPRVAERGPLPTRAPAKIYLRTFNASGGTVDVNDRVRAVARIKPFVPDEVMQIRFVHGDDIVKRRNLRIKKMGDRDAGKVKLISENILEPGRYRAIAVKKGTSEQEPDSDRSRRFHPVYPDLDPGDHNGYVSLFNSLLKKRSYYLGGGRSYSDGTSRAVMAFRKVNNMSRSFNASPQIFKILADGRGGFNLQRPGTGHHVEVDISRQVMVLADNGRPQHIFHVSTGAPSTPSDRGSFRFYRKDPGFNSIGMYYSVYYNRGEATHGYKSVPPYPASHGCIRNPIPNSVFIYNWIHLGDPIYVYG